MPEYFDVYVVRECPGGKEIGKGYFQDAAWMDAYDKIEKIKAL
jgi:hypothetical protein